MKTIIPFLVAVCYVKSAILIHGAKPVTPNPGQDIVALAEKLGLGTLVSLVAEAELVKTLKGPGPFTVFGPTNESFADLPDDVKKAIKNVTFLKEVLEYHVLPKDIKSANLSDNLVAKTVNGKPLRINIYKKKSVYTAQCAPIDLNNVDQIATNGVIHELKAVMLPPKGNIVETLVANRNFSLLVRAVKFAQLVDVLAGAGPFTLFAPTNAVFAKLPPWILAKLFTDVSEMAEVLKYHVVPGVHCSAGLESGPLKTLMGDNVNVQVSSAGVKVEYASVIVTDVSVTNGVIHLIDFVLFPPPKLETQR